MNLLVRTKIDSLRGPITVGVEVLAMEMAK